MLTTNRVGNFLTQVALTPPLAVSVAFAGTSVSMAAAETGAGNKCHGSNQRVHVR